MKRKQPGFSIGASNTGSADAAERSVAVSGTVVGNINLFTGTPVRTRYLEQVRRIAPHDLVGRDKELAELARFCTDTESELSYRWWRAKAWAGKSALMSWFVLNPPLRIRIVCFFITKRLASQDDRVAFIENVLEQLATLLDEPLPAFLTESTRDAHLLGLLSDAAHACEARGDQLVLVVDGLDEDTGVISGANAYSIAALLPDPPPASMRIIVAGRPNPPIPADVPTGHQLRDPAIVRHLSPSPFAAVIRNDMEGELKRLLLGDQVEQDLLGLLTISRGGLSGNDLAELTDKPNWQVGDVLRTVTGRSFRVRPNRWLSDTQPDVYLLGHEELQEAATKYLGKVRLEAYRERLHDWAERYRERGWPEETPEYLLRGYYQMLRGTGDLQRMVALVTDGRRRDRLLNASGGDSAALEEIAVAQDLIASSHEPDLIATARLAVIRDNLTDRNTSIPAELPAAWAALGQVTRAEALARSISHPGRRAMSLIELVKALATSGDIPRAESIARSIQQQGRQGEAMMILLRAAAAAGDIPTAEAYLKSVRSNGEQTLGLAVLAYAAAKEGDQSRAGDLIAGASANFSALTNPRRRVDALSALAQAAAATGDVALAKRLLADAEDLVESIKKPGWRTAAVAALIRAIAIIDGSDATLQAIAAAEALIWPIADVASRARALVTLARAATAAGEMRSAQRLISEAEQLARSIRRPDRRADALATLLRAVGSVGIEQGSRLAEEAETVARSIGDTELRAAALSVLSRVMCAVGDQERASRLADEAEAMTRSVVDPERRAADIAVLAKALAAVGMLDEAEEISLSIANPHSRHKREALIAVAKNAALAGDLDRAKKIAYSISGTGQRAGALAAVAKAAAAAGMLEQAKEIASSINEPDQKREALTGLAEGFAMIRGWMEAEVIAESIASPRQQAIAYVSLAETSAKLGDSDRAMRFLVSAEDTAGSITNRDQRTAVLVNIAKTAATAGNLSEANRIAMSITVPRQRSAAQAAIVKAVATMGNFSMANSMVLAIEEVYWRIMAQIGMREVVIVTGAMADGYSMALKLETSIQLISDRDQRESLMIGLVKAFALAGHQEKAENIIKLIVGPRRRAEALIALSEQSEPQQVPTLIARALQSFRWTTSLTALIVAQPPVLEIIVNEVIAFNNSA